MDGTDICCTSSTTIDDPESASYAGAIFSGSTHFTVAGGTFTNITKNCIKAPSSRTEFRAIPFGDIDLREICVDSHSSIINHERPRCSIRRVHSAQIDGRNSGVTVAIYQGDGAEQTWREDITKYTAVRHPNIVQVYGTATLSNIHATIFHDDLIPLQYFWDPHQHSHFATVYIYAYCALEFTAVEDYFRSAFHYAPNQRDCTFFVRRSTGLLCVDLVSSDIHCFYIRYWRLEKKFPRGLNLLNAPNMEVTLVNSTTLDQYHHACYWRFSQSRSIRISTSDPALLGAVYSSSSNGDWVETAYMPDLELGRDTYSHVRPNDLQVLENGWTRVPSGDVVDPTWNFQWEHSPRGNVKLSRKWLSQANHIFNCLEISSNLDNYVLLDYIGFQLAISPIIADPPEGFLFLCPLGDFRTENMPSLKWPKCPAYWSFDPSGAERLSAENAADLGFPSMLFSTEMQGWSWDNEVYGGLRQFHQAKGFDPDSQDLARHLGYPFYQLSNKVHRQFAYTDGEQSCEGNEESDNIREPVDTPDVSLNPDHQQSNLTEAISASNTFKFFCNFVADFIPGTQDAQLEGVGFSPILV